MQCEPDEPAGLGFTGYYASLARVPVHSLNKTSVVFCYACLSLIFRPPKGWPNQSWEGGSSKRSRRDLSSEIYKMHNYKVKQLEIKSQLSIMWRKTITTTSQKRTFYNSFINKSWSKNNWYIQSFVLFRMMIMFYHITII